MTGVLTSPLFQIAILITGLSYSRWWVNPDWIEDVNTLIPNLLGFSLGTYGIIFGIISGNLKRAMREVTSKHDVSYLEKVNATFLHFIFVQVLALIWMILYRGTWASDLIYALRELAYPVSSGVHTVLSKAGSFFGHFLLVYSILLMIGAAVAVYRLALLKDPEGED